MTMRQEKSLKVYVAYSGEFFTIEWYFDSMGNSDVFRVLRLFAI